MSKALVLRTRKYKMIDNIRPFKMNISIESQWIDTLTNLTRAIRNIDNAYRHVHDVMNYNFLN